MTFKQFESKVFKNAMKVAFDTATGFKADVSKAPVVSGDLKRDWQTRRTSEGYAVSNNMVYAPKIWIGKPSAPDTWKVPNGLHPIYLMWQKKFVNSMAKDLL